MVGISHLGAGWLGRYGDGSEAFTYSGSASTRLLVNINGSLAAVARESSPVSISLGQNQGSATFSVRDARPPNFAIVAFGLGSFLQSDILFRGRVQGSDNTHEELKTNLRWDVAAIDSSAEFNRNLVWASYTNTSATLAARDLLTQFGPDFTGTHIAVGLVNVTATFYGETLDGAFTALARQIGGYYYRDGYDVHLFVTETPDFTPDALDINNTTLQTDPPLRWSSHVGQHRNRVVVIGAGTRVLSALALGETIIPVQDASLFNATGTVLVDWQRLTYTSAQLGNIGALVGPGVAPSSRLAAVPTGGAGIDGGVHQYAYVWHTAAGDTLPAPLTSATYGTVPTPSAAPGVYFDLTTWVAFCNVGDTVQYALSASTDINPGVGADTALVLGAVVTIPSWTGGGSHPATPHVTFNVVPDPLARYINVWRSVNGAAFKFITNVHPTVSNPQDLVDASFGGSAPPAANPVAQQGILTGIAVGPATVTQRKVYRTVAGGTQLKLLATIADNTTTQITDSTADSALGANAPGSDTSGLTSPTGVVSPGSTTLLTAGVGGFPTAGWVIFNSLLIRYTGITGNTLTGIPASGIGSITASMNYGATIVSAPSLGGVTLVAPVILDATVSLYTERNNTGTQTSIAAIEGGTSTGVYSLKIVDTTLLTQTAIDARGDADLVTFSSIDGILTITYRTIDRKSRPGRPVHVNLLEAGLLGDFVIQTVNISNIDAADGTPPWFDCTASSVRFSLEDLLRHVFMSQ